MSIVLDGTSGLTSPAAVLTTTPLAVTSGGTGVITSTGSGANVLGTSPTITGATITVAATAAPAFSAYLNANQGITAATYTKVTLDVEEFDTNSNFASSRFTPTVSGYYQINGTVFFNSSSTIFAPLVILIYKNGVEIKRSICGGPDNEAIQYSVSSIVSLNGSTDYIELYCFIQGGTGIRIDGTSIHTYMSGAMIRSA